MKVVIGEICLALRKYNIFWRSPLWRYRYFWRSHQAAFCQGWSHIGGLCSFELIIKGVWWTPFWRLLKHTQLEHEMWRFPKIHLWGKSPCDFINSIELHKKKHDRQSSPNIGERSSKCIAAPSKVSFSLTLWRAGRARPRNQKYSWRSGNTTYFEDRPFEVTIIFDDRIKPHCVKVEATLAAYAHLSL